jgi:hypothetical protein
MTRLKIIALPTAIALGFAIFGCGGSDETPTAASASSARPLTKAAFIKRADAICAAADKQIDFRAPIYREAHEEELGKLSPIAAEEKMIRVFLFPSIKKQVKDLEALDPPKGDEAKIQEIIVGIKEGMKKAEKKPYILSQEVRGKYPYTKVSELARAYGFKDCDEPT